MYQAQARTSRVSSATQTVCTSGATKLKQVRGEWFGAASSLFAFCSRKEEKEDSYPCSQVTSQSLNCSCLQRGTSHHFEEEVAKFQHLCLGSASASVSWLSRNPGCYSFERSSWDGWRRL